jgi:ABC-type nitrate/sulfonate/bicarbonate transport system substrate-binding protein
MFFLGVLFPVGSHCREMITFLPQWVPQAQFAGYYMAHHKYIYGKYGLHVTIIQGGPDKPSDEYLSNGRVDLSSLWLTRGIQLRDQAVRIVNIAQIVQQSALMLVARKSSNITTIETKKPEMWKAFATASLEGWQYAFSNPEETLDVIMEKLHQAHIPASRVHQRWMLEKMKKIILPDNAEPGVLKIKDYETIVDIMKELGIISSSSIPCESFYKGRREEHNANTP